MLCFIYVFYWWKDLFIKIANILVNAMVCFAIDCKIVREKCANVHSLIQTNICWWRLLPCRTVSNLLTWDIQNTDVPLSLRLCIVFLPHCDAMYSWINYSHYQLSIIYWYLNMEKSRHSAKYSKVKSGELSKWNEYFQTYSLLEDVRTDIM